MGGRSLLNAGRRFLAVVILALLAAPSLGMLLAPYETRSAPERRVLAPPPAVPTSGQALVLLPRRVDAWFADHFAWRGPLVEAALDADTQVGLKPRSALQAVRGRGDWLLLYSGLLGATGGETRPAAAARYARFACDLEARTRGHAQFLFAPAPGPVEIYPEALPDWVPRGSPTQTDLVLRAASHCGLQPLDLRPALKAAKGLGQLYQHHDTHWTDLGAMLAFDAVAQRLRRPWGIDPSKAPWRWRVNTDSDLIRLSGDARLPPEPIPTFAPAPDFAMGPGRLGDLDHGVYKPGFESRPPGATVTVLVIGDSYTSDFVAPLFWRAGVALAWVHQAECGFDRRVLDRVRPDVILLMPSSRFAECR